MRIRVRHQTRYVYANPAAAVVQNLRLTPRSYDGQYVASWRLDLDHDCRFEASEDAFGNVVHAFALQGPVTSLTVSVDGVVDTVDTHGVVSGTLERFPVSLYLRPTDLTAISPAMRDFLADIPGAQGDRLEFLHEIMRRIHAEFSFDADPTHAATTAADSFALKAGVCQDYAQVFIALARHAGIPARYVGGYFLRADGLVEQEAGHAWAEAYVPGLGWIGFDPANGICPTDAHIRIAVGLDSLGAAPVRGTRYGGGGERLDVSVHVDHSAGQ